MVIRTYIRFPDRSTYPQMIISQEDRESFTKWLEFQPDAEHLIDTAKSTGKISTNIKYGSSNVEKDIEMPQLAKLWSFQNGKLDPDEMMKPGQDLWSLSQFNTYHDKLRLPKDVALKQISRDISKNYRTDNFPAYRARWGDDIFKDVKPAFSDESYKKLLSRKPSPYDKVMVDATLKARRGVSPEEIDKYIRTGDPGKKQSQVVMAASELSHLSKYKRLPDTSELKGKYIIEDIAKHKNLGDTSKTYYNQELDSAARSWLGTSSNVSRPTAGYQLEKTAALFPPKGKDRAASFEFEMEGGSGVKTLNFLRNLKGKKRDLFNKYFELDTDGTLAGGGLELRPSMVPKKDMKACIGLAQELMRKGGWTTGKNTSTHLHVDARDLVDKSNPNLGPKPNQMLSFLRRNDHLLETVVNPSRVGNKYTQRVGRLPHAGMTGHNLNIVSESLTKYGTYENRMLEGTSDPSKVLNWYDFNQSLVAKNASSDLSKQPYHEKFSDMTKAVGAPKSTVDYYKDLERKADPMSRNVIPVHPRSLLEGEKLYDAQGKIKPIEQFQIGDEILSYDIESHKLATSYVIDKFDHLADNVCIATLQTSRRNEQVKLTSDHPTLTMGNTYVPINEDKEWVWLPGQTLATWRINHNPILKAKQISNRSKGEAHSKAIRKFINNGVGTKLAPVPGTQHVWDLQCEPYKNFVHESGLILHNCRCYWEKVPLPLPVRVQKVEGVTEELPKENWSKDPKGLDKMPPVYRDTMRQIRKLTAKTGHEHAAVIDPNGKLAGIFEGDEFSMGNKPQEISKLMKTPGHTMMHTHTHTGGSFSANDHIWFLGNKNCSDFVCTDTDDFWQLSKTSTTPTYTRKDLKTIREDINVKFTRAFEESKVSHGIGRNALRSAINRTADSVAYKHDLIYGKDWKPYNRRPILTGSEFGELDDVFESQYKRTKKFLSDKKDLKEEVIYDWKSIIPKSNWERYEKNILSKTHEWQDQPSQEVKTGLYREYLKNREGFSKNEDIVRMIASSRAIFDSKFPEGHEVFRAGKEFGYMMRGQQTKLKIPGLDSFTEAEPNIFMDIAKEMGHRAGMIKTKINSKDVIWYYAIGGDKLAKDESEIFLTPKVRQTECVKEGLPQIKVKKGKSSLPKEDWNLPVAKGLEFEKTVNELRSKVATSNKPQGILLDRHGEIMETFSDKDFSMTKLKKKLSKADIDPNGIFISVRPNADSSYSKNELFTILSEGGLRNYATSNANELVLLRKDKVGTKTANFKNFKTEYDTEFSKALNGYLRAGITAPKAHEEAAKVTGNWLAKKYNLKVQKGEDIAWKETVKKKVTSLPASWNDIEDEATRNFLKTQIDTFPPEIVDMSRMASNVNVFMDHKMNSFKESAIKQNLEMGAISKKFRKETGLTDEDAITCLFCPSSFKKESPIKYELIKGYLDYDPETFINEKRKEEMKKFTVLQDHKESHSYFRVTGAGQRLKKFEPTSIQKLASKDPNECYDYEAKEGDCFSVNTRFYDRKRKDIFNDATQYEGPVAIELNSEWILKNRMVSCRSNRGNRGSDDCCGTYKLADYEEDKLLKDKRNNVSIYDEVPLTPETVRSVRIQDDYKPFIDNPEALKDEVAYWESMGFNVIKMKSMVGVE